MLVEKFKGKILQVQFIILYDPSGSENPDKAQL